MGLKKFKARFFYGLIAFTAILVLLNMAGVSGIITNQAKNFSHVFEISVPLSTTGSPNVIRCTTTNNLYYEDDKGNKILYSTVPQNLPAASFYTYQGQGTKITGWDIDVTAFCDPIPQIWQTGLGYSGFYLTGGTVKDTFTMKGTNTKTDGVQINQETVNLPPSLTSFSFGKPIRMDGQGIVHLYQKHFDANDVQNTFGNAPDQNAIIDNNIIYNLQFKVTDSSGNYIGYVWNTNWGDDVTQQIWMTDNTPTIPPSTATPSSKVENLAIASPSSKTIDESLASDSDRTITFTVTLPQFVQGEASPSVSIYYTQAVNGITNSNPVSTIQLSNPAIDSSDTAKFTGTFVVSQIANTGIWKFVLNPAVDTSGKPVRDDPSNVNQAYFYVINTAKKGQDIVCPSGVGIQTDQQGNQYCGYPSDSKNTTPSSSSSNKTSSSSSSTNPATCDTSKGYTLQNGVCLPPYQQWLVELVQYGPWIVGAIIVLWVILDVANRSGPPHPRETISEY